MVKNFAHRGFSGKYPENTLLAFEKAIELGSHGSGYVRDYNYEELLKYDFSATYMGKVEKQKLPLLKEYFELVKETDIISNIELKNSIIDYEDIEKKVYNLVIEYGLKDKVIVSSFNHDSILRMKEIDASIKCGFLVDYCMLEPEVYTKKYNVECYHPPGYNLTKEKIDKLHKQRISVNVWLGKEQLDYKELIDLGIDILITDNPDQVKEIIQAN